MQRRWWRLDRAVHCGVWPVRTLRKGMFVPPGFALEWVEIGALRADLLEVLAR